MGEPLLAPIDEAVYRSFPAWNWSLIKLLHDHSPRHVQWTRRESERRRLTGEPDPGDTPQRRWLRAVHCLALEGPDAFARSFAVYDGRRDTRIAAYRGFLASVQGRTVISPADRRSAEAAARAIRQHPRVAELMADGRPEVSIAWTDAETGLPCKARCDWVGPAGLLDLKTLGTVHERDVSRICAQNLYHGQLAHYVAGLRALGIEVPAVYLVVAEGKGAQDVAVYEVDDGIPDGALHVGAQLRARLMARLAECVETDRWPGRHEDVVDLCLPVYALEEGADDITFGDDDADIDQE